MKKAPLLIGAVLRRRLTGAPECGHDVREAGLPTLEAADAGTR